jgi:hypothetical protein
LHDDDHDRKCEGPACATLTEIDLQLLSLDRPSTSSASIAFFFLYMLIFGGTINVVPWVWGPEILPLEARAKGTAISVSSHWIWNFTIVMLTPVLINRIGWRTYIIFTLLLASFVPIVYFAYPETSNLSLEEVDNLFLPDDHQVHGGSISHQGHWEPRRVSMQRTKSQGGGEKGGTEHREKV